MNELLRQTRLKEFLDFHSDLDHGVVDMKGQKIEPNFNQSNCISHADVSQWFSSGDDCFFAIKGGAGGLSGTKSNDSENDATAKDSEGGTDFSMCPKYNRKRESFARIKEFLTRVQHIKNTQSSSRVPKLIENAGAECLINWNFLDKLSVSSYLIEEILRNVSATADMIFPCYVALYLNSLGLVYSEEKTGLAASFLYSSFSVGGGGGGGGGGRGGTTTSTDINQASSQDDPGSSTTATTTSGLADYDSVSKNVYPDTDFGGTDSFAEICKIITDCSITHGSACKTMQLRRHDTDVLTEKLNVLVEQPFLAVSEILTEVCDQILLPQYFHSLFLKAVEPFRVISREEVQNSIENLSFELKNCKLDCSNNITLSWMKEKLFNIVIPPRFKTKDIDNVPVFDVFLNVLLGAESTDLLQFHSILQFDNVNLDLSKSEELNDVFRERMRLFADSLEEREKWTLPDQQWSDETIKNFAIHFQAFQRFVAILELCRQNVPCMAPLTVGCTWQPCKEIGDEVLLTDDKDKDKDKDNFVLLNGGKFRNLPRNVIYVANGFFFLQCSSKGFMDNDFAWASPCFFSILAKFYEKQSDY